MTPTAAASGSGPLSSLRLSNCSGVVGVEVGRAAPRRSAARAVAAVGDQSAVAPFQTENERAPNAYSRRTARHRWPGVIVVTLSRPSLVVGAGPGRTKRRWSWRAAGPPRPGPAYSRASPSLADRT